MKVFARVSVLSLLMIGVFASVVTAKAKFEPEKGCYLGAVLDWADLATKGEGKDSVEKFANGMKKFNETYGAKHAIFEQFFFYPHGASWEDKKFYDKYPTWDTDPCGWATVKEFVDACDKVGATPVLTIEPQVCKDYYTDWKPGNVAYDHAVDLAKNCAAYKKPIFVRFAHEMNGSWYPWASWLDKNENQKQDPGEETDVTPERYVTMFQNYAKVMKQYAPNVAMIWCPNQGWLGMDVVKDFYTPWYPGDEYVDWMSLDFYERGWYLPGPLARLWGGQFTRGLEYDSADDPATVENESINFYKTFCVDKNKPLIICETGATQSYRTDLPKEQRRDFSNNWKAKYWDKHNMGWIRQVYGTSFTKEPHFVDLDKEYPLLKGIIWFNQGKVEMIPAVRKQGKKKEIIWFNAFMDYRIGYNSVDDETKYSPDYFFQEEIDLYSKMINNDYFLPTVEAE